VTFSIEIQNRRKIARLTGSSNRCILGCTTSWQSRGRFVWNIQAGCTRHASCAVFGVLGVHAS